jgi:hypothetical protein
MAELILNLHMHTVYSDGSGTHKDIADAALQTEVDVVIVTDHNILVQDMEGYFLGQTRVGNRNPRRVLLLVGEEVHDPSRQPQKSHLLVFGSNREMASFASKPQGLIDQVIKSGGLAFIAHPYDPELPAFHEPDISWDNWEVRGYTGIELWNGFSEMKNTVKNKLQGIFHVFFPQLIAHGPLPQTLRKWDELTTRGQKVAAVGGSDAHALKMSMGPLKRTVFPYSFHFRTVNTHLLVDRELGTDLALDRQMVLDALRKGHAFVGYDLPAPTRGFNFSAQGKDSSAMMGDEIRTGNGLTFQVRLPQKVECRLLRNGEVVKTWQERDFCTHISAEPGVYRVECFIDYLGKKRGWIYSNPIYARP